MMCHRQLISVSQVHDGYTLYYSDIISTNNWVLPNQLKALVKITEKLICDTLKSLSSQEKIAKQICPNNFMNTHFITVCYMDISSFALQQS